MASPRLGNVLRFIRDRVRPPSTGQPTDAQLLEQFILQRDEVAFETLVHRHGALVLGVGRTVLSDPHAAEDVFQATFLVLASKASSVRKHESLASWLYGVAYRIALNAKASAARRRKHERQVATMPRQEPGAAAPAPDLRPLLVEELNRLPEKYRAPMVLCYLQGLSNDEAAERLRWPAGTVKGRLARAREVLRGRLARRGFAYAPVALVALLEQSGITEASVPATLVHCTLQAAVPLGLGQATLARVVSGPVAALAQGYLRQGLWTRVVAVCLLAVGIAGGSTGYFLYHVPPEQPIAAIDESGTATRHEAPPRLVASFSEDRHYQGHPLPVVFSADGKRLLVWARSDTEADRLILQEVPSGKAIESLTIESGLRAVTGDGRSVAIVTADELTHTVQVETRDLTAFRKLRRWTEPKCSVMPSEAFLAGETVVLAGNHVEGMVQPQPFPGGPKKDAAGAMGGFPFGAGMFPFGFGDPQAVLIQDLEKQGKPVIHPLPAGAVVAAAQVVSRRAFLVVKNDEEVAVDVLDLNTGKCQHLPWKGDGQALVASRDGKTMALQTSENSVQLWNVAAARLGRTLRDADNTIHCFAFSPDGQTLATASSDRKVKLWDVRTGDVRHEFAHPRAQQLLFAGDGRLLATASPEEVKVWALNP